MMPCNFRFEWGQRCFWHTLATFQTVIPAPGSIGLGTLHIFCIQSNDNARSRLCLFHIKIFENLLLQNY